MTPERPALLASRGHTIRYVAILLLVTLLAGWRVQSVPAVAGRSHVAQYLALLASLWVLFWFMWVGLRKAGTPLADVIGGRWRSLRDVLVTVLVSAAFWLVAQAALAGVKRVLGLLGQSPIPDERRTQILMAPHGGLEIALWILLSLSAGFCEETVFRGYLQRQFAALSGNRALGIALSAAVFGLGHFYQGWRAVVVIGTYGLLFGLLAHFARSVRPGMIAHAFADIVAGLT